MRENKVGKRVAFIVLAIVCIVWIFPLIWAIFTSFKSDAEIQKVGFSLIPKEWTFANFLGLLQGNDSSPVFRWFLNSMIISTAHTFGDGDRFFCGLWLYTADV